MDNNSLAHTKWNCKYHIVFTPKYRRQIIYKQISADIGTIIRTLCARKGVEIIEAAAMPDHIHLYVAIPPKYSVAEFVGYLKGKSSLMIFDRHSNLKYRYGNRHFWCRGYYVDTVQSLKASVKPNGIPGHLYVWKSHSLSRNFSNSGADHNGHSKPLTTSPW